MAKPPLHCIPPIRLCKTLAQCNLSTLVPNNSTGWRAGSNRQCTGFCYIPLTWHDKYLRDFKAFVPVPITECEQMLHEVFLFLHLQVVGFWQMCWSRSLCLHQKNSKYSHWTSLFPYDFFFFNACLNSSRKAFNFPQGKFHVANLFSAVRLTNTKTHFMLLFGKVHDIYVNTVFVTKA